MLLGPLAGGIIVAHTGYRVVFWLTGVIMLPVFLLTICLVQEHFTRHTDQPAPTFKAVRQSLPQPRIILGMVLTTMIIQITDKSISPILSLYVRELVRQPGQVTIFSGIVASAPGLVMLFFAPLFGRIGDRIGQYKILLFGLIASLLFYLLLGLTHNIWQVITLRLLIGISDAALAPSVQIILSKNTPVAVTGRVFSYNQTMQSVGAIIGPLIGATVAASLDYRYIFFSAAIFIMLNLLNYFSNFHQLKTESAG
jgi:DHA1 family multidrug resistance protein-like MFS transporter